MLTAAGSMPTQREQVSGKPVKTMEKESGFMKLKHKAKKPPLGSGERFKDLTSKLSREGGVKNPAALAASIGRKKYGAHGFAELAHKR